ncbi:hypothetical protein [Sulfurisoma sediminicola]|uniref:DnrO protein n=1 Tax=Sulfurisoma sediminicola TaxID=1381557 RepID=A0A497X8Z1_9PROT|nr:hypothetical protein [Sulfurisoma sediminicola]RLJ62711.1 hypothetical protein DFR35_2527 [Sulfurisoma sediminicola]
MKRCNLFIALLSGVSIGAAIPAKAAESHDHRHEAAPAKLQLNQGKKWASDATLRQAMAAMRAELAGKLHAIHKGSLAREDYAALGKSIEGQIGAIVSQCKLEPKADAMLHIVIADLAGAAEVMQGKAAGQPADAAHRAALALNSYGKYFAHPGWQPIE